MPERIIRTPDQRLRVFVSSTLKELADERKAARDAITHLRLAPVMFELGARPHPARDLYRAYLDQSHVFIGIYWQSYGVVAPGETRSGLEDEYRLSGDKPKLIYIKTPAPDCEPRLKELLDRIRGDDTASYKRFTSDNELRELIENDLQLLLTERFEASTTASLPTGTVTFLFTDIEGSTELFQKYPDPMKDALARHHAILRRSVESHAGRIFQISGDAAFAAFYAASDALAAALAAQRALRDEPWADTGPIRVRMGLHVGTVQARLEEVTANQYSAHPTLATTRCIVSAGHGGQVLLSRTAADLVRGELPEGVTLRDMGEHRLKGLDNPAHLWQLIALDLPQDFPPLESLDAIPNNLPIAPNRFVGRERELKAVRDQLTKTRLLSLVGPGGTGKTRLALQAATGALDHFRDGVYFVDLASIRDPESALATIARAIGLREESDRPLLDQIKGQLRTRKMLALLDNFEQLIVAAPMMAELIRDCPQLTLLVTSREALHVRGETTFLVPPLSLPQADLKQLPLERVEQSEAVQLFVERAQAVKSDFRLTNENARAVAELCIRLDGLPLAVELATARLNLFSPQALVERLGNRLKLLRGGARDLPIRQQTLRDTIAWSYELLDTGERSLFELFAVFFGSALEAVEEVAGRIRRFGEIGVNILDGVSSLVDKSLIRPADHGNGESRLVMLETIREYAAARLAEDAEFGAAARRAHATYYADLTQSQWAHLTGDGRETALMQLTSDIENIRSAWRYWVAEANLEQLGKFIDSLWMLYDARGWYHATVELTTDLLNVLSTTPSTPERAEQEIMLQTSLARALMAIKGYTQEVEQAYLRALELCRGEAQIPQLFPVLRGLSSFYILRAEFEKGARMGERILNLADHLDDVDMRVEGHLVLGYNLASLDNLKLGLDHLERGIAAYDPNRQRSRRLQLGTNPGVVCHTTSALFLWMLGFPDRARKRASDAVALARKLDHSFSMAYALFHYGLLHLWLREAETAQASARALLEVAQKHEFQIWSAVGSCLRGAALAGTGSAEEGLTLIQQGMNTYRGLKTPPVFWPMLLHLQAGACGLASRPEDGLELLNEAIRIAAQSSGKTLSSEFFQLKGDLLLALSRDNEAEAESWFQNAVNTAVEAHARMLELRAALRLSRLWRKQGKLEQARKLLGGAYETFTEGFTTADLREAKAQLDDLA